MRRRYLPFSLLLLLLLGCARASDLEGFDDEEQQADHHRRPAAGTEQPIFADSSDADARSKESGEARSEEIPVPIRHSLAQPSSLPPHAVEIACGILIAMYLVMVLVGERSNKRIADAWARAFAFKGCMFDRNFSSISTGDGKVKLMRESGNLFKFYATGRRHCQGLLAELQLLPRWVSRNMIIVCHAVLRTSSSDKMR